MEFIVAVVLILDSKKCVQNYWWVGRSTGKIIGGLGAAPAKLLMGWAQHRQNYWWVGGSTDKIIGGLGAALAKSLVGWGQHWQNNWWVGGSTGKIMGLICIKEGVSTSSAGDGNKTDSVRMT
jgi:hypothetical protein